MQAAVVVIAKPAFFVVEHLLQLGQPRHHRLKLVDLLLVLDRGETHFGMGEHIGKLIGDGIGIDRHRNRAQHLPRHHRPIEHGAVGADHRDGLTAPEAKPMQADRIGSNDVEHLGPGPSLPNAEVFVPHGGSLAEQFGVANQ